MSGHSYQPHRFAIENELSAANLNRANPEYGALRLVALGARIEQCRLPGIQIRTIKMPKAWGLNNGIQLDLDAGSKFHLCAKNICNLQVYHSARAMEPPAKLHSAQKRRFSLMVGGR